MNHDHHTHVIDSYVAGLALEARDRRRERLALTAAPAVTFGVNPDALETARRNFTEPRWVPRNRGDRPSRFIGASPDTGRSRLAA